jgi:hypothetical protein
MDGLKRSSRRQPILFNSVYTRFHHIPELAVLFFADGRARLNLPWFGDRSSQTGEPSVSYTDVVPGNSSLGFDADPVVHGGSDSLLAAKVSLRRLNRTP